MRKQYDSDITREQFENIRPILEGARRKTKPRTVDIYEVFCAVLYVLKSACQWRMIPGDFPKWRTVYSYFQQWTEKRENECSLLEEALKKTGMSRKKETGKKTKNEFLYY